jgi:ankyrin repeat protein
MALGMALFAMTSPAATNDVSGMLQKGLFEEEANRNLDAAIQAYQSVITQTDKDRKFAATAIFRLGECYRKLGKTNEATTQYERIVQEFGDQTELVKLSQGYVGSEAKAAQLHPATASSQSQLADWEDADIQRIKKLLKDSPDLINAYDQESEGTTPLNQAVGAGRLKVVKFLLDNKADIELRNRKNGQTPLMEAVANGNREMVLLLLDRGADVNAGQTQGRSAPFANLLGSTALHYAADKGYRAIAEDLIAHKANVNAQDHSRRTPLFIASEKGYQAMVELLLSSGATVDLPADNTPLYNAALSGNVEMAKLLLAKGADVNSRNNFNKETLLIAVGGSEKGILEIAELLLTHRADVNATDLRGETPLIRAVRYRRNKNGELAKLLIEHGAEVNSRLNQDNQIQGIHKEWSALDYAVSSGDQKIAALLLENGANPNVKVPVEDERFSPKRLESFAPLHVAVAWNNKNLAELLINYKADINAVDSHGNTPLLLALNRAKPEKDIVELLVNQGADVNIGNADGTTPLMSATWWGELEIMRLLITHGSDVNRQDKLGRSVLDQIGESNTTAEFKEQAAKLLRESGGVSALEITTIRATRPGWDKPLQFFRKDKEGMNRYSLLELIGKIYTSNNGYWGFPDFNKTTIIRRTKKQGKTERIEVALGDILESGDCSKDVWLEWGDVVEIPEVDHRVNEQWGGLSGKAGETVMKCTARSVQIQVKGQVTVLTLKPFFGPSNVHGIVNNEKPELGAARLRQVVYDAGVILASSDLARVKVTRHDPVTKKVGEKIFDLRGGREYQNAHIQTAFSPATYRRSDTDSMQVGQSNNSETDLWLREGDVIEIPEKKP